MTAQNIMLCGLPESGKSTFLAALWYQLFNSEIPLVLSSAKIPSEREYVNKLAADWARCRPVPRNTRHEISEITFHLQNGDDEAVLCVPDMSGETWIDLWATRVCSERVASYTRRASGIMLFIHSDKIIPPVDLLTTAAMGAALEDVPAGREKIPWNPEKTPTQIMLVDCLQALTREPLGASNRRLAVVLSAWDKAADTGLDPQEFLQTYCPLLDQFVRYSGAFDETVVFGISALGGDFETDSDRLRDEDTPSKRVIVVKGKNRHHDLTAPIQWLMQ